MFKIDLEKSLVARKSDSIFTSKEQLILDEANSILEKNEDADIAVLKKMGLDYAVREKETLEKKRRFMRDLDKSRIFSQEEIKDLCLSFRLKFLPIYNYKGSVDPQLPSKINEFEKIYNSTEQGNNRNMDHQDFMICAPKESFKLKEHPIDPLLFYPIGGGFYYLVHKWGNDISALRWLKALKFRNFWTWYFSSLIMYWSPLALLTMYVFGLAWGWSFAFLGGSIIHFLFARFFEGDYSNSYLERRTTEENWDNNRTM